MTRFARRTLTGLALVGLAYALSSKKEGRSLLAEGQIDRWKDELRPRLDRLQERYGPTIRKMAVAAGFMPGLRLRWRVLAAAMPQIVTALQSATGGASAGGRGIRAGASRSPRRFADLR